MADKVETKLDLKLMVEVRRKHIGRLLLLLWRAFDSRTMAELRSRNYHDISPAHSKALRHLDFTVSRITEMAERAGMTKQGMGRLVRDLAKKGYLGLTVDPSDRRAQIVSFTDRGLELCQEAIEVFQKIEAEYTEVLGSTRMRQVKEALQMLLDHLDSKGSPHFPLEPYPHKLQRKQ